jgi:hypothetical protein
VLAFVQRMEIPALLLLEDGEQGSGLLGTRTLSGHVPPPSPSDSTRVVAALGARDTEVSAAWARQHWGCDSDIVENRPLRHSPLGGSRFFFFTYGGAPDRWCETAAQVSHRNGHDVLLVLVSHNLSGKLPDRALALECAGATGVLCRDDIDGVNEVREFLRREDCAWDGLTLGPFYGAPYIPYIPRDT